jgi:hypothetical protein
MNNLQNPDMPQAAISILQQKRQEDLVIRAQLYQLGHAALSPTELVRIAALTVPEDSALEACVQQCPIIDGTNEQTKRAMLDEHRTICLERRAGLLGLLCGMPQGPAKDAFSAAARTVHPRQALGRVYYK